MQGPETPTMQMLEDPMAYGNNGQGFYMPGNMGVRSAMPDTRFPQPPQFTNGPPNQKLVKKAKCGFPMNICCCCCCEDDGDLPSNMVNDPNRSIILKPIRRERIVEVMREEVEERVINVPQIQYVDKFVEVPKPVIQYKMKEVKRPVIVEKIKKVPKVVEEERIIEVPEVKYVEKQVDVPQIVKRERIVEVPLPVVRERRIPVLRLHKNETYQEVDNINYGQFGGSVSAAREGGEVPHATPTSQEMEGEKGAAVDEGVGNVTSHSESSHRTLGRSRMGLESATPLNEERVNMSHNKNVDASAALARTRPAGESEEWSVGAGYAKRAAEASGETGGNRITTDSVSAKATGNSVEGSKVGGIHHSAKLVTEIITARSNGTDFEAGSGLQHSPEGGFESTLKGGHLTDYRSQSERNDDSLVSIYPDINALSIRSNLDDEGVESHLSEQGTPSSKGRPKHAASPGVATTASDVLTHVRITK
ncbi:membrane skeletal protein IMC1, putative [Babesia caballi]|uniref:Membrane skeletal protein IMC1, putative n=1 Tax=Babesia caballi TaxID=5871 RepID=A0AAV4LW31_BABCB|nr:membrane skeletal protein IMC1, putative [Babesia caballi]